MVLVLGALVCLIWIPPNSQYNLLCAAPVYCSRAPLLGRPAAFDIWLFLQTAGPFPGRPYNESLTILGSIVGPLIFGNFHLHFHLEARLTNASAGDCWQAAFRKRAFIREVHEAASSVAWCCLSHLPGEMAKRQQSCSQGSVRPYGKPADTRTELFLGLRVSTSYSGSWSARMTAHLYRSVKSGVEAFKIKACHAPSSNGAQGIPDTQPQTPID